METKNELLSADQRIKDDDKSSEIDDVCHFYKFTIVRFSSFLTHNMIF